MQEFKIGANEAGQRLDKFLHKYLKEAGSSFLYKMLRKKNITLNQKKADGKEILAAGDCVQFFFSQETFLKFRGQREQERKTDPANIKVYQQAYRRLTEIRVIYENEHILLMNKPAGILAQKAAPSDISVNEWLIGYLLEHQKISQKQLETFRPSICNRLDRNTSGLMICGKSFLGSQRMNHLIKERKIQKFYRTFVKGRLEEEAYIKAFLKKDEKTNKVFITESCEGKEKAGYSMIETAYRPLGFGEDYTYLEVQLITGKTHQIRAHLASIGHPLLGDEKYGDRKWNAGFEKVKLPGWQLLHSYRMVFPEMEGEFSVLSGKEYRAEEPEIFQQLKM